MRYGLFSEDGTLIYSFQYDFDPFNPQTEEQVEAVEDMKHSFNWTEIPAYYFRSITDEEYEILTAEENMPGANPDRQVYDLENGGLKWDNETLHEKLDNDTRDYEAEIEELKSAMVTAMLNGDDETVEELKQDYKDLMAEYTQQLENTAEQ